MKKEMNQLVWLVLPIVFTAIPYMARFFLVQIATNISTEKKVLLRI